jgi:hypothetical protein
MRPFTTSDLGSVTISDPVLVDYIQGDFNVGLSINVVTGTNTSKVQYSLDDPHAEYATDYNTDATWHDSGSGVTADTASSLTVPCRAVRLNMTAWTSGTANLTVVQGHI